MATLTDEPELDCGEVGASVGREHARRKANREARTRAAHPRIGGLLLAVRSPPQHEKAFEQGRQGELVVAKALERRIADGPTILLHDRRMPRGRGNIDHLAIAPSGVFVIDAKNYAGKKVRVQKPLLGSPKLTVAGRDRTKLVDALSRQAAVVRAALDADGYERVPLQGVLCFSAADLPLLGTPKIAGHLLLFTKALGKRLNADGPLSIPEIDAVARALAAALPAA